MGIWRGSRLISRFFIVFIWINRLVLLGLRWFVQLPFSGIFLSPLLWWILSPWAFLSAELSSTFREDERGGVRSRDLDLSSLLERPLCSADGGGPADGDEGFISENSSSDTSSDSGVTTGWVCGSCGTCTRGYIRSRDLDRHRCLSSCGDWSASSSFIRIGKRWGSGGEGRRRNLSRDVLIGPTFSITSRWWSWRPSRRSKRFRRFWTSTRSKRNIRIIKEFWWRRKMGLISSFVLRCSQLRLTSQIFFPEHKHSPRSRIKCATDKVELGNRTNPHANWPWTGFPEEHPSSPFTAGYKDVKIATKCALKHQTVLEMPIRQKLTSKDCHMRWKILCNCWWITVKDQLFPCAQWLAFVNGILNICSHIFR